MLSIHLLLLYHKIPWNTLRFAVLMRQSDWRNLHEKDNSFIVSSLIKNMYFCPSDNNLWSKLIYKAQHPESRQLN